MGLSAKRLVGEMEFGEVVYRQDGIQRNGIGKMGVGSAGNGMGQCPWTGRPGLSRPWT